MAALFEGTRLRDDPPWYVMIHGRVAPEVARSWSVVELLDFYYQLKQSAVFNSLNQG